MSGDTVDIWRHGVVVVETPSGEWEKVMTCEITDDDVRDDGTIEYPPSGECDCNTLRPGVAFERTEGNA